MKFIKDEKTSVDSIDSRTWIFYFFNFGFGLAVTIALFLLFTLGRVYLEFHIAGWVAQSSTLSFADWAGVYVAVTFAMACCGFLSSAGLVYTSLRASLKIHNLALRRLLDGKMSFFWTTPIGRIINRLSRDVDQLDYMLPFALDQMTGLLLQALGIFVAVAIIYPFAIITFPFLFFGFFLLVFYLRAGMRQFRRLAGVLRSFVTTSLDTCIVGSSTIRAMNFYDRFEKKFEEVQLFIFV